MSRYIFFLGGYDAEMVEIKNIIQSARERLFDKSLSWGAALSSYKEEIVKVSSDIIPVFIELKADCSYPENSEFIDHHDEKAGKCQKTSIEQVADLLGIKLNRQQQLISANDRGHIRAMKELCATDEEIMEIRALDRKAQGVTDEDERLAEESIEKHLEKITDNAVIVHSLTNKTSAVFDRLYDEYKYVFAFTPDGEINYSGTGAVVKCLVERVNERQKENPSLEFWYGGELPDYGFFGAKIQIGEDEIKEVLNTSEKKIISQHIFMFPFRIVIMDEEKKKGETNINMCEVFQSFIDGGWEYKPYRVDTPARYSEYYYFHEYVRKAIFEQRDIAKIEGLFKQDENPDVISYYFERHVDNDSMMTIYIKKDVNGNPKCMEFELKIDHLSLRLFSTDIGILTIELLNYDYPEFQDVMYINEYGRRIYPQFLPDNCDINEVKNAFLSDRIEFKCISINSKEDFCPITKYFNGKLVVADYITKLLGDSFTKRYNFIPIIDDRMFTVCWHANADLIKELQKEIGFIGKYKHETSDEWYSFVFIDGSVSGASAGGRMKENLIKQFTYPRWIHTGTLYGITRYSLMCLTHGQDFLTYDVLRHHIERMYYQIAIILLAQRASILKFSDDVSRISGKIESIKGKDEQKKFKEIAEDVKNLHSSFIHFVNRLWFTEVTPQEQGIEMYNMAVKNMGLTEQLNELRHEIEELHEFVEMQYEKIKAKEDRRINKTLSRLNWLVVVFLPITVVSGLLGMNIYTPDEIPKIINIFNEPLNIDIHSWRVFYQRLFILVVPTILIYLLIFVLFLCNRIYTKKKE